MRAKSRCWRHRSTTGTRVCWPCWPMASPGPARHWHLRWAPASATYSGHWMRSAPKDRYSPSVAGGRVAGPAQPCLDSRQHCYSLFRYQANKIGIMPTQILRGTNQGAIMKTSNARILREYGPFTNVDAVHGVTFDGRRIWLAAGDTLKALDPDNGTVLRSIDVAAHAGTAFDGRHLFQIDAGRISKIDPETGKVLGSIPAPGGADTDSGLAWAEGSLWIGQYRDRKIHQLD